MATTIGTTENTLEELVTSLISLEYDAIAAYDSTVDRLDNNDFKSKIAEFKQDHDKHLKDLKQLASTLGVNPPEQGSSAKQMLTSGKVAIAGMMGDKSILKAMKTNEDDTVTAYERAVEHKATTDEARGVFEQGLKDERRHREWMQTTFEKL